MNKLFFILAIVLFNSFGVTVTKAEAILELEGAYSKDDILKSYKKLALKYHPDKNLDKKEWAEEKFRELKSAYDFLKDYAEDDIERMRSWKSDAVDKFQQRFARKKQSREEWEAERAQQKEEDEERREKIRKRQEHPDYQATLQHQKEKAQRLFEEFINTGNPESAKNIKKAQELNVLNMSLIANVMQGNMAKVQELIGKGADVNFVNSSGMSPLKMAKQRRRDEIIEILMANDAIE